MTYVIDLPTHLHIMHHLYSPNPKYMEVIDDQRVLERQVFLNIKSLETYNSLFDFDVTRTALDDEEDGEDVGEVVTDSFHQNDETSTSIFDFSPNVINELAVGTTAFPAHETSPKIMKSLNSFRSYLETVSGGLRSLAFNKMDQTNLKILLSSLGIRNLFCLF